jgi:hypothetical protein
MYKEDIMRHLKKVAAYIAVISLLFSLLPAASPVFAQPQIESLDNFYRNAIEGDVLSAGVGLRGSGEGDIFLPAPPGGASFVRAFLYWSTLGTGIYQQVTFQGEEVLGEIVGHSRNPCWESPPGVVFRNYVYRADVTDLVVGGGTYTIEGLPDNLEEGNDSQGASLVAIYSLPGDARRTIFINDGSVTLDGAVNTYTDTLIGIWPDVPLTDAHITYIVANGQPIYQTGDVRFDNVVIANNIFQGTDGDYWDNITIDVSHIDIDHRATTSIDNVQPGQIPDCIVWAATVFSVTTELPLEVEDQLEPFFDFTGFGGVTAAGVGLRGNGIGNIVIDDIPGGSTVHRAFLYWSVLGTTGAFEFPSINGAVAQGEVIGISDNPCWFEPPGLQFLHFNYRADVTEYVPGNGTYTIGGLPDNLAEGNDSQGASLVIIYRNMNELYRTVIINDGGVTLDIDDNTWVDTIENFETSDPLIEAEVTYIIADGQDEWQTGDVRFNQVPIAHNVFTGVDGDHWGTLSFDVTFLDPTSPSTTQIDNIRPDDPPDCIVWVSTIFSITPPQPEIHTLYLPVILKETLLNNE